MLFVSLFSFSSLPLMRHPTTLITICLFRQIIIIIIAGGSSICNTLMLDHSVNEPIISSELCCFTGILIMLISKSMMSFDVPMISVYNNIHILEIPNYKKMGFPSFECYYAAYFV